MRFLSVTKDTEKGDLNIHRQQSNLHIADVRRRHGRKEVISWSPPGNLDALDCAHQASLFGI